MKTKESGSCSRQIGKKQINRTKYVTEQDATNAFNTMLDLQVINTSYVVYKCPACKHWHFGDKEWSL
jgi:hypothetical protein